MSKNAEDVLVKITASYSRKKNGIAFNIEWKKEMDRKEFEKILDEIVEGLYKWKDKYFHPFELKEKKE